MLQRNRAWIALLLGLGLPAGAMAHHSFAGEFDRNKPITLTGMITKVEWANPHGRFFIDVKGPTGEVIAWEIELGNINSMIRNGWTRNTLKAGDSVTVEGFLAIENPHLASASQFGSITLADGRKALSGGPFSAPPSPSQSR